MGNEIILRSVYGKVGQIYFIQPCPNPKTGQLPSHVRIVDDKGNMILSEKDKEEMSAGTKYFIPADKIYQIVDGAVFNLDDLVERSEWEAIQYCNWIAKDRYERDDQGNLIIDGNAKRYGVADLYVDRPGEIMKTRVNKKMLVHRASTYVYDDTESGRIKKARVMGRDIKTAIPADVIDYLISIAEKDPKKIIDLYEGEDWRIQLVVIDAIDKGVIKKKEGIYTYDDKLIGGSMDAVVLFMKDVKYKKMIDSIKRETYPELLPKQELTELEQQLMSDIPSEPEKVNGGTKKVK